MEKQVYRIAGRTVEICSLYPQVHSLCSAYRAAGRPQLTITVSQDDIDAERRRVAQERANGSGPEDAGADAYLETLAVYRKLAEGLLHDNILLFHGSAVAVDGACYLFAAKSGIGKSTHAALWRQLLGERAVMVNDDKPLLQVAADGTTVFGTPWCGKHRLNSNIAVPLRALCLLEQGEQNRIERLTPKQAWPVLWRQSYRPAEPALLERTLALTHTLAQSARLYRLCCTPDLAAARLAYETMREGAL